MVCYLWSHMHLTSPVTSHLLNMPHLAHWPCLPQTHKTHIIQMTLRFIIFVSYAQTEAQPPSEMIYDFNETEIMRNVKYVSP